MNPVWKYYCTTCYSLSPSLPTAIQTAIRLHTEGKTSLHKDLKLKRREQREQREKRRLAKEEEQQRFQALQEEKEHKLAELELLKEAQRQAQALLEQDEMRRRQHHEEMQQALEVQLREAKEVKTGRGGGSVRGRRGWKGGVWLHGGERWRSADEWRRVTTAQCLPASRRRRVQVDSDRRSGCLDVPC